MELIDCCICQEENVAEYGTPDCCCHRFCVECIVKWTQLNDSCPLCKQQIKVLKLVKKGVTEDVEIKSHKRIRLSDLVGEVIIIFGNHSDDGNGSENDDDGSENDGSNNSDQTGNEDDEEEEDDEENDEDEEDDDDDNSNATT